MSFELNRFVVRFKLYKKSILHAYFHIHLLHEFLRMLLLHCFSSVLLAFAIQAAESGTVSENVYDVNNQEKYDSKDFWKLIFNMYYDLKGLRNESTDNIVESFFEHEFEAYPDELYPLFRKIFEHISKSNDRIWNFYESILYLYHNIAASDRIYETMLMRADLGKLLHGSEGFDLDAAFPLDKQMKAESADMEHRSGEILLEEEPVSDLFEHPCGPECGVETLQVGSIRAIPGVHFPNYEEIPITSFTCAEKYIPGFYADLETGCQVFHVCYPHRRESFLCPVGTIFNQAILACDYWYSSNCSLSPLYFHSNRLKTDEHLEGTESFVDHLLEQHDTLDTVSTSTRQYDEPPSEKSKSPKIKIVLPNIDWTIMLKFLPIKSKITECPDFCGKTIAYPIESEPEGEEASADYAAKTTPRPIIATPTVTTATHKKEKYDEKTAKSEILLDILKAVEVLTKDAEGFLTDVVQKKLQQNVLPGIKTSIKLPKAKEPSKPTLAFRSPTEVPKSLPKMNQRFIVKPVGKLPRPTISRNKVFKLSKTRT